MATKHRRIDGRWFLLIGVALALILSSLELIDAAPGQVGHVVTSDSGGPVMLAQYSRCPGGRCPP